MEQMLAYLLLTLVHNLRNPRNNPGKHEPIDVWSTNRRTHTRW